MTLLFYITKRELKSLFVNSMIAMVILFVMYEISGLFFYPLIADSDMANINGYIQNMIIILLFALPIVTARAWPEERRNNTLELLYTSPLSNIQIYFGKFLAYFIFYLILIAPVFTYLILIFIWGTPAIGPIVSSMIGYLLTGALFVSVGMLFSIVAKNQVVAGIISVIILLSLYILEWIKINKPLVKEITTNLSLSNHLSGFFNGTINFTNILYFVLIMIFIMYMSITILENKK